MGATDESSSESHDPGTSNSAVAAILDGHAHVIEGIDGAVTPSCVAVLQDKVLVGEAARRQAILNPLNTFASVKRLVGRQYSQVQDELHHASFKGRPSADGGVELWCHSRQASMSPEQISAYILQRLVRQAEEALGEEVDGAVIAVPAHFDDRQRQATIKAGRLAGLTRLQLLQEPVAASIAYGLGRGIEDSLILVFDLGGGTFDVSLVECFEGCLEVLATGGDARLGGNDWDSKLMQWVLQQVPGAEDRIKDTSATHRLLEAVEAAKRRLSSVPFTGIDLPFWDGERSLTLDLTRLQFEEATADLRTRLWPPLEQMGRQAFVEWAHRSGSQGDDAVEGSGNPPESTAADRFKPQSRHITQVVMVGGATAMPLVQDFVREATGIQPQVTVDPALCVALGAAMYGGALEGTLSGGFELADGAYSWDLHDRVSGLLS
ncbi:g230 [Coccomyxa elongata]